MKFKEVESAKLIMITYKLLQNMELSMVVNGNMLDYEDRLFVVHSLRGFIVIFATIESVEGKIRLCATAFRPNRILAVWFTRQLNR
jgi:hypothetical protein